MAINNESIIKHKVQQKPFNGESFTEFITGLIEENKYSGMYFLMDNYCIHKKAVQIIKDTGNNILFIPPYSPEFNPIEEVFSHLKWYVKKKITPLNGSPDFHKLISEYIDRKYPTSGYYRHAFGISDDYG